MIRITIIVLITCLTDQVFAVSESSAKLETLTRAYIATLDKNPIKQKTFYAKNARFRDPTSGLFGDPWDVVGPDSIVSFLVKASEDSGTLNVDYKITDMVLQPPFVSSMIEATVTSCGVGVGFPEKTFTGTIKMTMVLKFESDKIIERTDYAEYEAAMATIESRRPALIQQPADPRCARFAAAD